MGEKNTFKDQDQHREESIAAELAHRFGLGLAIRSRKNPASLLQAALEGGFLDDEGYLTRKGRALLARYH